jgi:hypothetical protein
MRSIGPVTQSCSLNWQLSARPRCWRTSGRSAGYAPLPSLLDARPKGHRAAPLVGRERSIGRYCAAAAMDCAAAAGRSAECAGRRFKPIELVFGSVSLQVPSDQVRSCQRSTGAPAAGSTRRLASAPVSSGSCDRLQSYVRFRRNVANGRRRRADSTIAVRRNGAGSGAHHFRLAHLRFALMMTARAQPTTGRGGADGGDGG